MGHLLNFYGPTQGVFKHGITSFRKARAGPVVLSVAYQTAKADFVFSEGVANATIADWAVTVNAVPNVVFSVVIDVDPTLLSVSWTTPGVSTDPVVIDYTRGTLVGLTGVPVKTFQESGVIP